VPHNGVGHCCVVQRECCGTSPSRQERVSEERLLCRAYGNDMLTSIVGHWVKIVMASKIGEAELHDFAVTEK